MELKKKIALLILIIILIGLLSCRSSFTGNDLYHYDPYQKILLMVNSLRKLDVENIKEIVDVWHRSMLNDRDMARILKPDSL